MLQIVFQLSLVPTQSGRGEGVVESPRSIFPKLLYV